MNSLQAAVEELYAALGTVDGVRVFRGTGTFVDPPGATVGPPTILREFPSPDPSSATFQVALVVAASDNAMDDLLRFEPLVAAVLDVLPRAAVGESKPGLWRAGGTDLPAQLIDVTYAL